MSITALRLASLAALILAAHAAHAAPATGQLNDTGIDKCETPNGTLHTNCADSLQDADTGRDVTEPANADGRLGFKWTKLAADGSALPASATQWSCIADQVTGLVWEMKSTDGTIHDASRRWSNGDGADIDAAGLVSASNAEHLCGRSDWRLPARGELQGIVDYSQATPGPTVDAAWFPNSDGYSFWTSTVQANNPEGVRWYVNFQDGWTGQIYNSYAFGEARVVSGTLVEGSPRYQVSVDGQEVFDTRTGLTWARCTLGQNWDGTTCVGKPFNFTWRKALAAGARAAAKTGEAWRVPNAKEFASIAVDGQADPDVDATLFPNSSSRLYWTSSPYVGVPFYAWTFYGYDGTINFENMLGQHLVRLVR